jgi:hypothetical protein
MEMVNAVVVERSFGGSLQKSHAIAVFNAHNDEVRRLVPADRLFVYESGEGLGTALHLSPRAGSRDALSQSQHDGGVPLALPHRPVSHFG